MRQQEKESREPSHTDICLWLDFYSELLSVRQREVLTLYYNEDWSLSEISKHTGLSRQGIHGQIKRGVARLCALEDTLGLALRDRRMEVLLRDALRQSARNDHKGLRLSLESMMRLMGKAVAGQEGMDGPV